MIGRNKTTTFNYIKDKVWQRISYWSSKCLPKTGREVMIKSMLQIPSNMMSNFLLPNSIIITIEKMINSFGGVTVVQITKVYIGCHERNMLCINLMMEME